MNQLLKEALAFHSLPNCTCNDTLITDASINVKILTALKPTRLLLHTNLYLYFANIRIIRIGPFHSPTNPEWQGPIRIIWTKM